MIEFSSLMINIINRFLNKFTCILLENSHYQTRRNKFAINWLGLTEGWGNELDLIWSKARWTMPGLIVPSFLPSTLSFHHRYCAIVQVQIAEMSFSSIIDTRSDFEFVHNTEENNSRNEKIILNNKRISFLRHIIQLYLHVIDTVIFKQYN